MSTSVQQQTQDCKLHVTATQVSPSLLRIHYQVTNQTAQPLYLFNRLDKPGGKSVFDTSPDAVDIALTNGRVTVSKTIPFVPDDREVEARYTPCMSRVEPRGTYDETLELSLPLVPLTRYDGRPQTRKPLLRPLYFELGYLVATPQFETRVRRVETSQGLAYYLSLAPERQTVLAAGPLLSEVSVFSER